MAQALPDEIDLAAAFQFLDELRESGVTNMFGAGPYLTDEFGLGRREASAVLKAWMDTFDPSKSADIRAIAAEHGAA